MGLRSDYQPSVMTGCFLCFIRVGIATAINGSLFASGGCLKFSDYRVFGENGSDFFLSQRQRRPPIRSDVTYSLDGSWCWQNCESRADHGSAQREFHQFITDMKTNNSIHLKYHLACKR